MVMALHLSGQVIKCLQESALQDYEVAMIGEYEHWIWEGLSRDSPSVSAASEAWVIWLYVLSYMIASTFRGRTEAPGYSSVSCEGTKRFKSWQFRNTVDVWGKVVFEYNPSIWRVLWFKGPGNRRHDWLLASTKTSLGFLKKRTKSDLYWLPDTRCKPASKELLWRFMLISCFVMMRLKKKNGPFRTSRTIHCFRNDQ